jgi:Domain of unknown function (DUF4259)
VGTWGVGPFDNDMAADWSGGLDGASDSARVELIEETLRSVADETDYLDSDFACEAIAAAAVVASQLPGGPAIDSSYAPDFLTEGGTLHLPPQLSALALRALDRIVDEDSEWRDLWDEAEQLDEAVATLAPIREALTRA